MNTPILIPVDEIIHTFAHPYCGNGTCLCNTPLRDPSMEDVAQMRAIEQGMSIQEAREILRITTQDLGDGYRATYDSEVDSLQLVRVGSETRMILTLDVCYQLSDFLTALLPLRKDLDSYLQWRLRAMLALCKDDSSNEQPESEVC